MQSNDLGGQKKNEAEIWGRQGSWDFWAIILDRSKLYKSSPQKT